MSVKASWFQIGLSGTANLNFHWRNLLDGVLRLTRGNAGAPINDVMLVNADNSVGFPSGVSSGVLGTGQTWQNLTGSRAAGVTYTNSTGKPIEVSFRLTSNSSSTISFTVAGNTIPSTPPVGGWSAVNFIVPDGSTYSIAYTNAATFIWAELR